MIKYLVALAATAAAIATPATAAELVTNGGFETGDFTGYSFVPVDPAADIAVTDGTTFNNAVRLAGTPEQFANHFAAFGGGQQANVSTISQTFDTVAGQTYTVSFDYGALGFNGAQQQFTYVLTGGLLGFGRVTGTVVQNADGAIDLGTAFTRFSQDFTSVGGATTISFTLAPSETINVDGALDNISVTTPDVTGAVPEPATWGMLLLGMGMVGAGMRARRRSTGITFA